MGMGIERRTASGVSGATASDPFRAWESAVRTRRLGRNARPTRCARWPWHPKPAGRGTRGVARRLTSVHGGCRFGIRFAASLASRGAHWPTR